MSKINLIWIIPALIGSLAIGASSIMFLKNVAVETLDYDLWLGIFQIGLTLIVLDGGLVYFGKFLHELNRCFPKGKREVK